MIKISIQSIRSFVNKHPIISVSTPFIILGVLLFAQYLSTTIDTLNNQATISTSSPETSKDGLSDEEYTDIAQRLYTAKQSNTIYQEQKAIEDEHGELPPVSFIDGDFDYEFLDYFISNTYAFWNPANANKSDFSFQIFHEKTSVGEFSITAWPYIEGWSILSEGANQYALLVLAKGKGGVGPVLEFRSTPQSKPFRYELSQPIASIYPLDFYDYDGDGKQEIGLRYEITGADGFWQELVIFKVDGQKLTVLKNFPISGRTAEGIARRVGNTIEIGGAFSGDGSSGHLGYDKYLIEKYQYKNGDFQKVGEKTIPHPLLSSAWKNYFLK